MAIASEVLTLALGPVLVDCMRGLQIRVSVDRGSVEGMEGEQGSCICKDFRIFVLEGVLQFGATFAWRSSKLILEDVSATLDTVFSSEDICDILFKKKCLFWSVIEVSLGLSGCSRASEEASTDLVG